MKEPIEAAAGVDKHRDLFIWRSQLTCSALAGLHSLTLCSDLVGWLSIIKMFENRTSYFRLQLSKTTSKLISLEV